MGRLKILLGVSGNGGKTHPMLDTAQCQNAKPVDVETPDQADQSCAEHQRVDEIRQLAEQLGDQDVMPHGLRKLLGKPLHPHWKTWLFGSGIDDWEMHNEWRA